MRRHLAQMLMLNKIEHFPKIVKLNSDLIYENILNENNVQHITAEDLNTIKHDIMKRKRNFNNVYNNKQTKNEIYSVSETTLFHKTDINLFERKSIANKKYYKLNRKNLVVKRNKFYKSHREDLLLKRKKYYIKKNYIKKICKQKRKKITKLVKIIYIIKVKRLFFIKNITNYIGTMY